MSNFNQLLQNAHNIGDLTNLNLNIEKEVYNDDDDENGECYKNPYKYAEEQNTIYDPNTNQFLYGLNSNMRASGVSDGTCNQLNPWIFEQNNICGSGVAGGNTCKKRLNKMENYFDKQKQDRLNKAAIQQKNALNNANNIIKNDKKNNISPWNIPNINSINADVVNPNLKIPSHLRRMNDIYTGETISASNTFNMGNNKTTNDIFLDYGSEDDSVNENFDNTNNTSVNAYNITNYAVIILVILVLLLLYKIYYKDIDL